MTPIRTMSRHAAWTLPLFATLAGGTAPAAAQGAARMIYPDYGGASQTCVIPVDPQSRRFKVAEGAVLALGANPSADQCKTLVVSKQRISIAGKPNLCINIGAGAHRGVLYIETCKDTAVTQWDASGTAVASARIRAVGGMWDNQCWTIPDLPNDKARYPIDVAPADCQKNAARELKFFVE